jgi:hypothetical protein
MDVLQGHVSKLWVCPCITYINMGATPGIKKSSRSNVKLIDGVTEIFPAYTLRLILVQDLTCLGFFPDRF